MEKHTLGVLVNNRPGVLSRVAGLFSRRGFNIESLAVGPTEDEKVSRMTIVAEGDDPVVEQISKQLYKLIDVIKVYDLTHLSTVERELLLIKVTATVETRPEITQIVDIFRARVVDVAEDSVIIEATGDPDKIDAIENMFKKFGIKELVRTGRVSLIRSSEQ